MSGTGEAAPSGRTLLLGAAEQKDVKRVEEEARWATVGYASTADLSQAEDQLRLEVEAADAAALQAAIDAAAASDEAGVALYEAQFGSVAVGRLLAGSLAVNQYVESTGYVPGSAGWHIDADGSVEFNSAIFRGAIESTDITGGTIEIGSNFRVDGAGNMRARRIGAETSGLDINGDAYSLVFGDSAATGGLIRIYAQGGVWIGSSWVLTYADHNHNQGTLTTAGTTWNNGTGLTGEGTGTNKTGGWHKHQTDGHTHQVTI